MISKYQCKIGTTMAHNLSIICNTSLLVKFRLNRSLYLQSGSRLQSVSCSYGAIPTVWR